MSWNDAKTFCMNEGGKLFEPRDSAENSEVPNYAFNTARLEVFWFGIEDLSSEGTFVYASNGDSLAFTNWAPNEPDDLGDQNCVRLYTSYEWDDYFCKDGLMSVCERVGDPPPPPSSGGNLIHKATTCVV